ncbi:hypothetical protein ACM40_09410 [Chryseobacterium sp. BLS98]|uniref:hypothetical protein n=1 Tax=Chryseobacterium sp. BLS98 TaxID=885586 RepID=UPI00065AA88B|nr:hypothetical protein [Chryseobacterium sp. BLS98]KMQ62492.1 hypothetical protein ACM40_09410 [Chryseobacterium sp. BLS98]
MNIFRSILNSLKSIPNVKIAKQITMSGLHEQLVLLNEDKTEFDFIGINSNKDDCLYFRKVSSNFNIEFEAIGNSQILYFEKIKNFAIRNNYSHTEETNNGIPYLIVKTNTNTEQTILLARQIQNEIFGNNENTVYDIVP